MLLFPKNKLKTSILRVASLFGFVQLVNFIFSIVRNKLIVLWLGPGGIGLISLLNNALNLIASGTDLGLPTALIKDISKSEDTSKNNLIVNSLQLIIMLAFVTGLLTFLFAGLLAKVTFGDLSFKWMFQWMAVSVFFRQIVNCIRSIQQGVEDFRSIALANIIYTVSGFVLTVPVYYFYREEGIMASIVLLSITEFLSAVYFLKKLNLKLFWEKWSVFFDFSSKLVSKSYIFSVVSILSLVTNYLLGIYITDNSDLQTYGYYSVIYIILNNYLGLIFTFFSYDYLPRLVKTDTAKLNGVLNDQIFLICGIMTIVSIVFILFPEFVLNLLYGSGSLSVSPILKIAVLGMVFKSVSWCISFVILAKSPQKVYFWIESIFNILFICGSIYSFKLFKVEGIWLFWVAYYFIYLVTVYFVARISLNISLKKSAGLIIASIFLVYLAYFLTK